MKTCAITFTVPGTPEGKGRPRFNGASGRTYTPKKTREYEARVRACAEAALQGAEWPEPRKDGVWYTVQITAHFKLAKSLTKRRLKSLLERVAYTSRPDIDNVSKAIVDALNGVAYKDDAQVSVLVCEKRYTQDEARVDVDIIAHVEE